MSTPRRGLHAVTPSSLTAYLVEVRRRSVPTPEEEIALGQRIRAGNNGALHELVERNLRFVVQVAGKYQGYGLPLADLINEGNLGLLHAAGKFDPERGVRFITYAVWWIRQAIMHAIAEGGNAVRLPIKQAEALSKLRQKFDEMQRAMGTEPTVAELANALDMKEMDIQDLLRVYRPCLSLDAPIQENGDTTQLDFLQSNNLPSSEEIFFQASMAKEMQQLLGRLEPREARILRARFGFDDSPKSLAAIGRELSLSRERVRQIETRARNKLRAMAKEKALNHYLN
ncbi:MAG: RNA polymerase sigma factor RpoD/SigA [Candidatus Tectomicrobia bacterium]|nr:RNA polymerase sigma factor RpoD/SigA [Candidatus Tectomicrobia bacterium]